MIAHIVEAQVFENAYQLLKRKPDPRMPIDLHNGAKLAYDIMVERANGFIWPITHEDIVKKVESDIDAQLKPRNRAERRSLKKRFGHNYKLVSNG